MKTLNKILISLGIVATAFGFSSCVRDLDLEPQDPRQLTDVANDMDAVFADIYLNFSTYGANGNSPVSGFDGGMAAFQRAMFIAEEIPTDEASWLWDYADYGTLNNGLPNVAQGALYGFYSRLIINITLCNQFISKVNEGYFNLDAAGEARAKDYVRQAKILWGACYYYMLSFYDKIPYADESTPVGSFPPQLSRKEVYANVTSKLESVVAEYGSNQVPHYGFVGLDAAEAILAKIYLNAEVFTGTPAWQKCYSHCKNIIDRLGKGGTYGNGLVYSYNALFGANNRKYALGNAGSPVNEIIWPIVGSEQHLNSYSGAGFLIAGWIGTNAVEVTMKKPTITTDKALNGKIELPDMNDEEAEKVVLQYYYIATAEDQAAYDKAAEDYKKTADDSKESWKTICNEVMNGTPYSFNPTLKGYVAQDWYNLGAGWKCMVARKSFVSKFDWNDYQKTESDDRRVSLWQTAKHGFNIENESLVGDDWGNNGYLAVKYSNWAYNDDGTINYAESPTQIGNADGDYAAIRLAEIYLTAAEAILNGGGGSNAEATEYVNHIITRAYAGNPGGHLLKTLSMKELQEERCRELYQENVRRTDLIRWNLWCSGYNWEWKGGVRSGTNLPAYTKLYPIPSRVMSASNFEQTTGY